MKLYPPLIENTILASNLTLENNNIKLVVPYTMNPGVSLNEISGISIKIKTINNNTVIYSGSTRNYTENKATFSFTTPKNFNQGNYYKIQIAYRGNEGIGYYSTLSIIKFCKPISLQFQKVIDNNIIQLEYSTDDVREKIYSYYFELLDINKQVLEKSDVLLYNNNNDQIMGNKLISNIQYQFNYSLSNVQNFMIKCYVETINGIQESTTQAIRNYNFKISPNIQLKLQANNIEEQGYIDVNIADITNYQFGHFLLKRTDEDSNFQSWVDILSFDLGYTIGNFHIWKDYAIENGKTYQYAICQYNNNLTSSNLTSNKVIASFEDMFLFDKNKQLNIKFNPTISTYKENILEQKIETIGSKYPFIYRNGNVRYKEIGISGLISYVSDQKELFIEGLQLNILPDIYERKSTPDTGVLDTRELEYNTNLSGENIIKEKKFREIVLEWLNNGKIKCFKSPTEGNVLVQLTNVSLTPEQKLGRMLYSFSATAYEVKEYNSQNIIQTFFGDLKLKLNSKEWKSYKEQTFELKDCYNKKTIVPENCSYDIVNVWFQDVLPGTVFSIQYKNQEIPDKLYTINNSGALSLAAENNAYIQQIVIYNSLKDIQQIQPQKEKEDEKFILGQVTIGYYSEPWILFNSIQNVEQFDKLEYYTGNIWSNDANIFSSNLMDYIQPYTTQVKEIFTIQFTQSDELWEAINELDKQKSNMPSFMYQEHLNAIKNEYMGKFIIDNQTYELNHKYTLSFYNLSNINTLKINKYVNMTIYYGGTQINYDFKERMSNTTYIKNKQNFINLKTNKEYRIGQKDANTIFCELKKSEKQYNDKIKNFISSKNLINV